MLKLYFFDKNGIPVTKDHYAVEENLTKPRLSSLAAAFGRNTGDYNMFPDAVVISKVVDSFKRFEKNKPELFKYFRIRDIILSIFCRGNIRIRKSDIDLLLKTINILRQFVINNNDNNFMYIFEACGGLKKILEMMQKNTNIEYIALEVEGFAAEYINADIDYPNFLTDTLENFENMDWVLDYIRDLKPSMEQNEWFVYEE